jgi:hypothetical protein
MKLENSNPALRAALNVPEGTPCGRHEALIAEVAVRMPHSIRIHERFFQWTCVPYALCFAKDPVYCEIARYHYIFATADFINYLLESKLKELEGPSTGCLALYFDAGRWTHAGVVKAPGRLISKWGLFPVYDHPLEEVPASYGNEVRFFPAPRDQGFDWFLEYGRSRGLSDTEIEEAKRVTA